MVMEGHTFLDMWKKAWLIMDAWDFPLEQHQRDLINNAKLSIDQKIPSKKDMAYFITEHFQSTKWPEMPEDVQNIIRAYKFEMMEKWNWPKWGYSGVERPAM